MHTGVVDKRTSVPQIRPEVLPLIGSAIILGRDIKLQDKIGQGMYERMIVLQSTIHTRKQKMYNSLCMCHAMHFWKHEVVRHI